MAEFFQAFWDTWKPGQNALIGVVAASPFLIWTGFLLFQLHRRADVTPPQQEKVLRPPGYSLQLRLEDVFTTILQTLVWTTVMLLIATRSALSLIQFGHFHMNGGTGGFGYVIFFAGLFIVSTVPAVALMRRAFKQTAEARNTRLGMRGEQAVAEALHELGEFGYRAFHDLQPKGTWNIDHVIVGTRGIFVIETKTRCRRPPRREQPKHVVIYDGRSLIFPSGTDREAIEQAQRNANWLSDHLSKKTCELAAAESIVGIPGWYVETKGNFPVKVMNANYLKSYLRNQPERIDPLKVRRIIVALDEQCRTLEF